MSRTEWGCQKNGTLTPDKNDGISSKLPLSCLNMPKLSQATQIRSCLVSGDIRPFSEEKSQSIEAY
jgi:hypothetical protein